MPTRAGSRPGRGAAVVVNRFAAAILGGYVFAFGFTGLAMLAALMAGLPLLEAQMLTWMLGLLVYLAALLWSFAPRSVVRVWTILAGGGTALATAAWALSRTVSS